MKFTYLALLFFPMFSGCSREDGAQYDMGSQESDATVVSAQKGRFEFIAARDPYPALIFDSATGCVETLEPLTIGPNAGNLIRAGLVGPQAECTQLQIVPLRLKNRKSDEP